MTASAMTASSAFRRGREHDAVVRMLLAPAPTRTSRRTAAKLHCSTRPGGHAVVRMLPDAGADRELDEGGVTPLYAAAARADAIVRTLLDAGADKDRAANTASPRCASRLGTGARRSCARCSTPAPTRTTRTTTAAPRCTLTGTGNRSCARCSTPAPTRTSRPAAPAVPAAMNGETAVVRVLLDAGADKTKKWQGKTAHDVAKTAEIKNLLR